MGFGGEDDEGRGTLGGTRVEGASYNGWSRLRSTTEVGLRLRCGQFFLNTDNTNNADAHGFFIDMDLCNPCSIKVFLFL